MKISFVALVCCWLLIIGTGIFYYPKWKQSGTEATISWDVSGYYLYLPAIFIYKDLKQCSFKDKILQKYQPAPDFQQAFLHESGNYVFKYSSGQAITMAPFFFAGHFIAKKTTWLNDGFSYPYQLCIGLGMLLYACIGLWLLRKILLRYFNEGAAALTLLTIAFATNYLNYAAVDGAMTHNTLFTLYCVLVYATIRFYDSPSFFKAAVIGTCAGLATLIRPTEIISVFIPLLWGLDSFKALSDRLRFFLLNYKFLIIAGVLMIFFISLQPLYWKWATGNWIVYSYQDQGFSWLKPHLYDGFFSSRSGWITYTPAMLLALMGFPFLAKKNQTVFWATAIFSFFFIYICFAWDIWWYGGSLGIRSMVQAYPILAFSMAALIEILLKQKKLLKGAVLLFLLFCTYYNFWLTHQAHKGGLLRPGEMTDAYLKAILFQSKVEPEVQYLLDNADRLANPPVASSLIYENDFESESSEHVATENTINSKSLFLNGQKQFTPEYNLKVDPEKGNWIRASASFKAVQKEWTTWRMTQFIIKFYNGESVVKTNFIRVQRNLNEGETKRIYMDAKLPGEPFNRVAISFWNADSDRLILIDDLKVLLLED
jgi:hypothetical protein